MLKYLKHIFTSKDNETFSMTKLITVCAGFAMIYNFVKTGSVDWSGFGTGIGLIGAVLVGKTVAEK